MNPVTQEQAIAELAPQGGEAVRFWRETRHGALECLSATFRSHVYRPHTHETYVLGVIEAGCETFLVGGVRAYAGPGDFCFVHPEEVHDGAPHGGFYSYRMIYPRPEFLEAIAADVTGRAGGGLPAFDATCVRDPALAARFARAHRAMEEGRPRLETDEEIVSTIAAALVRHARVAAAPVGSESGPVRRVAAYLEENFGEDVELPALAALAELSRTRLIRAFRKETGLTPWAWLTDRRVRAAREMLRAGAFPAEVALACGFCDQSHLNRAFKARVGVTPGVFRRAVAS